MGTLFRSEEMALAQLFIQPEAAYHSISELGEAGVVQFRDLNEGVNAFQRKFVNEVRRCDDMDRRLRYVEDEVKKDEVPIPDSSEIPRAPNPREIIDLEAHLEKTEGDIRELTESSVHLKSNFLELTQMLQVVDSMKYFFNEQEDSNGTLENRALMTDELYNAGIAGGHLGFVAGIINRERVPAFERMLWRISRGNAFFKRIEIDEPLEDPTNGSEVYKTVFAVFFQGEQLKSRIKKVCAGFHASLYSCPDKKSERVELEKGLRTRLEDLKIVLNQTQDHRQRVLVSVAKQIQNWSVMVRKMKAIYHTLNMFNLDVSKKCMIGEGWIPVKEKDLVQKALTAGSQACGSTIPSFLNIIESSEDPPTFNKGNKFTQGFQNLIDAYGIASYRELNPALYTIVSFPFLFAVMFGDAGHGLILLLVGGYLVLWEKKVEPMAKSSEVFSIFFGGRYIILLMGIFSIYTGLIYNDIFSKSINIFGSSWHNIYNESFVLENEMIEFHPKYTFDNSPYPMGVDPVWQLAKNKIIFLNSFKMKLSIVFGVFHMMFGLCLGVVNYVHFKEYSRIFLIFLPQMIFLVLLFLWMVIMMFMKWFMYGENKGTVWGTSCAPSILIFFINMMLFKKQEGVPEDCNEFMFEGQSEMQKAFVFISIFMIPIMLFGKPVYDKIKSNLVKKENKNGVSQQMELRVHSTENSPNLHSLEPESMGEVLMDQGIHTIEYVLSTISHTASYLRLWALSLAHAQLSEVLWNMVLSIGLKIPSFLGAPFIFLVFAFWASCTIAILVLMEGLSAFLHTLRLHWVEFMSKFYEGQGYPFQPFDFYNLIEDQFEES